MMTMTPIPALASPEEVAAVLGCSPARLANQRSRGTGPAFVKDGRRVLYRWSDVEAYLTSNTRSQTDGDGR
jgi:hypothetical protein